MANDPRDPVSSGSPFNLPDDAVEEFRAIWRRVYGEDLGLEEARRQANRVLRVFDILTRPPESPSPEQGLKDALGAIIVRGLSDLK